MNYNLKTQSSMNNTFEESQSPLTSIQRERMILLYFGIAQLCCICFRSDQRVITKTSDEDIKRECTFPIHACRINFQRSELIPNIRTLCILGNLAATPRPSMDFLHNVVDSITGHPRPSTVVSIKATVVLVKASILDFTDVGASILDHVKNTLGQGVTFQLVSSAVADANGKGKIGKAASLEGWTSVPLLPKADDLTFTVNFEWDKALGSPGAVIVKNYHHGEFYLKTITLEGVPDAATGALRRLHVVCNSWVYPADKYSYDRIFFVNSTALFEQTPEPLKKYRQEELQQLRGDHVTRKLEAWDRVYGYAYYNDLGEPDKGPDYARPVLGGSDEYPYPRRAKTNHPPAKADKETESRLSLLNSLDIYVPRDEVFNPVKLSDFLAYAVKVLGSGLLPGLNTFIDDNPGEFDSFEDMLGLYEGGPKLEGAVVNKIRDVVPFEILKELLRSDGQRLLKLPLPQIIQFSKTAWRTDEEFGREMLAGVNPVIITRLTVFPPVSKLDPSKYGDQNSKITVADVEKNMDGLSVEQALEQNKLFILDHHDSLMPYLNRINSTGNKIYASRTILLLKDDGTLKPLAIELSLPEPVDESHGAVSKVFTPADHGVEESVWQLAKAYAAVDDSGVHQLISHWLNTHAAIEPFAIATHRQLSTMHPIFKLLHPHYRDTMYINALARQILINAGGVLESTVFPGKYAMELSSAVYKNWKFTEQGLPADLLKRGVAVEDPSCLHKIRLLIEDYPYAVDGLAIWSAIENWVEEYCSIYYPDDAAVKKDSELQAWWKEIREVGHGDKKEEPWWPKMQTISELTESCTTIIWVASALHAAVNFGQYPYAGYLPNRPTISRRFMPEPGTPEYAELEKDPEMAFIKTITAQLQTILGVSLIEILSKHSTDEVYLGQRDTVEWTSDKKAMVAFRKFGEVLVGIETKITETNQDPSLKNRNGPAKVPYTLLYPDTSNHSGVGGLTGKGIPNSVSI